MEKLSQDGRKSWYLTSTKIQAYGTSDQPVHKVMSLNDLEKFLAIEKIDKLTRRDDETTTDLCLRKDQISSSRIQSHQEERLHSEIDIQEKRSVKPVVQKDNNQTTCKCSDQLKSKKEILETIEKKISVLVERQKLISQLDLHGSILFELIDIVADFRSLVIEKNSEEQNSMIQIYKQDNTYKIKNKNRIFIEGLVEFALDKYEQALKKSKKRNPFSLAYQFVKICFPESYFQNVTLGKKYYDESDVTELLEKNRTKGKDKFPLSFVWGFKSPFEEPLKGEFDLNRGQERVRALIEHVLRKSEKLEYNEDLENKIRQRLVKELCSRNKPAGKNSNSDDIYENEEYAGDENESGLSDIWDNNCFDGK